MRPEAPLVVAANRDERLDRPALPMSVLSTGPPRILGGRDELAGGTWLAVNEAGVVAGLTNRPLEGGRDPSKRSRGELPLALARHRSATAAVEAFAREIDPSEYNPAWMLVGDRTSAYSIDLSDQLSIRVEELPPGLHVLENSPPGAESPKVRHVRALLAGVEGLSPAELRHRLVGVLGDHEVPPVRPGGVSSEDEDTSVAATVRADCVHGDGYGTRWSSLISVPADASALPSVSYADGPPCTTRFEAASAWWTAAPV